MSKPLVHIIFIFLILSNVLEAQERSYVKTLFENSPMPEVYFFSKVEYTGGSWVKNLDAKLPVSQGIWFTPKNALEVEYLSSENGSWSVEIFYDDIRGIDQFVSSKVLSFWLFIPSNETIFSLPNLSLIVNKNEISKTVVLNKFFSEKSVKQWFQVKVPLEKFDIQVSLNDVIGIRFAQSDVSSTTNSFLIDQIEFIPEKTSDVIKQQPKLISAKGFEKHIDLSWEPIKDSAVKYVKIHRKTEGNSEFECVGIQSPWISGYSDFVGESNENFSYKISFLNGDYQEALSSNSLSSKTRVMTDEELLDMVQEAHLRYYWDGAQPHSGLALENIPGRTTMIATGASGFGIMAIIAGVHRGYISREDAVERFLKITRYLKIADRFHGVFPHFLDGETGKVVPFFGSRDNGADLVETSFLMQGLLVAKSYFDTNNLKEKEIRDNITQLWEEVEWDWFRQESSSDFLTWHWSPDQAWTIDHQLIGWNETMITYFLAIASPQHSVPPSMYYSGWGSKSEKAQQYRINWGQTKDGSMYTNGNTYYGIELPVGVSNGGPLFFTHYSYFGLDPHQLTDAYTNYFENNQNIAKINHQYAIANPKKHKAYGYDFWGLTASDGPFRYSADEANEANDYGKITPTGALASFPYTPEASMKTLKNFYTNYGEELYGFYGFYDAIALDDYWRSPLYMGLNQAPIVIMIENYRSGLIWKLFMENEDIQNGLKKLNQETEKIKK